MPLTEYRTGQDVLVETLAWDNGGGRMLWERAVYLGQDADGHPMVRFRDGQQMVLQDYRHILGATSGRGA